VEMVALAALRAHLPTADALVLCLPGTPETEGRLGGSMDARVPLHSQGWG